MDAKRIFTILKQLCFVNKPIIKTRQADKLKNISGNNIVSSSIFSASLNILIISSYNNLFFNNSYINIKCLTCCDSSRLINSFQNHTPGKRLRFLK